MDGWVKVTFHATFAAVERVIFRRLVKLLKMLSSEEPENKRSDLANLQQKLETLISEEPNYETTFWEGEVGLNYLGLVDSETAHNDLWC